MLNQLRTDGDINGEIMSIDYYKMRAEIIKAMAHPSRLKMIDALSKGELCVCELRKLVHSDVSTVSKHLSVMKGAGLVQDRKEGLKVFYRLICPCAAKFLKCVDGIIEGQTKKYKALARKRRV